MKSKIILILLCSLAGLTSQVTAQLKITDNSNLTINSNAILDLESDSLGFLPPRMAINDLNLPDPLIAPVTAGMTVYSTGGAVADGYYCWDGSKWLLLLNEDYSLATVLKSADDTLATSERMVLASNDILLTLPEVTSAENGLAITVKNIGTANDFVLIVGYDGATMDDVDTASLTRFQGMTYVAQDGNWFVKEKISRNGELLDVSSKGSWRSVTEIVDFLNEHMTSPTVVRFCEESFPVSETVVIDLPYPVTFQGLSFGGTTIEAASGLAGKPMFRCHSECYFKMLIFDGSTLENYGDNAGEDAIRFLGDDTYHEVKDTYFLNFNKAIVDSSNTELWILDVDFEDIVNKAIEITGAGTGAIFKISESDFTGCARGIDLKKAVDATVSIINCGFYGGSVTDSAIVYRPATFGFTSIAITGNTWNNTGKFINGFDFARTDGRDANAFVENNIGSEDKNPHFKINVINSTGTTSISAAGTWYKATFTNTSSYTSKWTIVNNRVTYQPTNKRDVIMWISGNIASSVGNRDVNIAICKNGVSTARFGETTLRPATAGLFYQYSTVVYLSDVSPADYFEVWVMAATGTGTVTLSDLNWFGNSQ